MNVRLETFTPLFKEHLSQGKGLLIASSGGPDSQCLLDLCGRLQSEVNLGSLLAVGLDHGLRPEASSELDLAEALAQTHGTTTTVGGPEPAGPRVHRQ